MTSKYQFLNPSKNEFLLSLPVFYRFTFTTNRLVDSDPRLFSTVSSRFAQNSVGLQFNTEITGSISLENTCQMLARGYCIPSAHGWHGIMLNCFFDVEITVFSILN
jgi:hypothetical protein